MLLADGSIHLKFKLTSTFLNTDLDLFKCCHNLKNPPTCVVSMSKIVSHDSPLVMSNILLGFCRVGICNILQFQDWNLGDFYGQIQRSSKYQFLYKHLRFWRLTSIWAKLLDSSRLRVCLTWNFYLLDLKR